jgi:hypothetical protein
VTQAARNAPDEEPLRTLGVFRWAWVRGRKYLDRFAVGALLLGTAFIVISNTLVVPPNPTWGQRIVFGLTGLMTAAGIVVILSFGFALLVAPYQQRNGLREIVGELEQRRDIPPEHVRELHEYARAQRELVARDTWDTRLAGALADSFASHFPDVAAELTEWEGHKTAVVSLMGRAMTHAWDRLREERLSPEDGEPGGLNQLLVNRAFGYSGPEPIWEVRDKKLWASNLGGQAIIRMDGRDSDPFGWVARVEDLLRESATWPEAMVIAQHTQRLVEMRRPLAYRLEIIERTHELNRSPSCQLCRMPGES